MGRERIVAGPVGILAGSAGDGCRWILAPAGKPGPAGPTTRVVERARFGQHRRRDSRRAQPNQSASGLLANANVLPVIDRAFAKADFCAMNLTFSFRPKLL